MATDLERLVVTLEASTKQYERAMARAQQLTVSELRKIEGAVNDAQRRHTRAMGVMGERMALSLREGFLRHARNLGFGLVGAFGFGELVQHVEKAFSEISNLRDVAIRLRMPVGELQAWDRAAILAGEDTDTLHAALEKLNEQTQTSGSYAQKFLRLNEAFSGDAQKDLQNYIKLLSTLPAGKREFVLEQSIGFKSRAMADVLGSPEKTARIQKELADKGLLASQAQIDAIDQAHKHFLDMAADWDLKFKGVLGNIDWDKINTGIDRLNTLFLQLTQDLELLGGTIGGILGYRYGGITGAITGAASGAGIGHGLGGLYKTPPVPAPAPAPAPVAPAPVKPTPVAPAPIKKTSSTTGISDADFFLNRGVSAYGVSHSNPEFMARLRKLMTAASAATGEDPMVTSMARSYALQALLRQRYEAGGPVAGRAGQSLHNFGLAADFMRGPALDWMHAHAAEYGLGGATFGGVPHPERDWPHLQLARRPQRTSEISGGEGSNTLLGVSGDIGPHAVQAKIPEDPRYQQYIDNLKEEQRQLALTDRERKVANDQQTISNQLATDGIKLTNQQSDALGTLSGSIYDQQQALSQITELNDAFKTSARGFVDDLLAGKSASEALQNALKKLADRLLDMAFDQLFSAGGQPGGLLGTLFSGLTGTPAGTLPKFQHGGAFKVGGAGGTDSSLVAFRATPGEMVSITPRHLSMRGGTGAAVTVGGTIINIGGSADEQTVAMMDRRIAAAHQRQRRELNRDWGSMAMRYHQLRSPA